MVKRNMRISIPGGYKCSSDMEAVKVTESHYHDQLLYFTSSSISDSDDVVVFISDRTGNPNVFKKDLKTGFEKQLTSNGEGTLKSYVYFNGNPYQGLGKASISFDSKRGLIYYIQGMKLCCVDLEGDIKELANLPDRQVTAFTSISADGKKICIPTTDARALEANDSNKTGAGSQDGKDKKKDVISDTPDYDIDERVATENLSSYLRVFSTETGEVLLCERVQRAWITHVQFSPIDAGLILYNHEWPSDCGIRRMWLFDEKSQKHKRLRHEDHKRSREDWTCHEMWQADGKYIIYHGKFKDGRAYIGRVSTDGDDNIELALDEKYTRYGHFTVGNMHNNWLVSDGYYHPEGETENGQGGGEWISIQKVDWNNGKIEWIPACRHHSLWDCQDSHPHPIFNHHDNAVYFTSNQQGNRAVYKVEIQISIQNNQKLL